MGNLSAHFDDYEFTCKCGCGRNTVSNDLIDGLEKIFDLMNARAIIVTSGFRCPNYSVSIGGYKDDAHTLGLAADIRVRKQDGSYYTPEDIAEAAERVGFGGIGLMNIACHVDRRDLGGYKNNHWFGDERNGNNRISTFQRGTKFDGEAAQVIVENNNQVEKTTHKVQVFIDNKEVYSGDVE